jgi:hemolysin III
VIVLTREFFGREPVNATTHFVGFWISVLGVAALFWRAWGDTVDLVGATIFGVSQALLFLASSCYHYYDWGARGNLWLRRCDHSAIYLLIAGSYVPPLIHFLDGAWRIGMLTAIAVLTIGGIVFKLLWMGAPRWLSVSMYLALGWIVVIPAHRIFPQIPGDLLAWLIAGGLAYSIGALVYAFKRPDPWPGFFGFHELWHIFVMLGAGLHYTFIFKLVGRSYPAF